MRSLFTCLDDAATPKSIGGDEDSKYNAYESYLGNIRIISTLLAGFTLTGSMLAVGMSGSSEDIYSSTKLSHFLTYAGMSALCSMICTIVTFLISSRGTDAYCRYGGKFAHDKMQHSILPIGLSEVLLYIAFWSFLMSMQDYAEMKYTGPDICPTYKFSNDDAVASLRRSSWCSMLGRDWYEMAAQRCSNASEVDKREQHVADLCLYTHAFVTHVREFDMSSKSFNVTEEESHQFYAWDDFITGYIWDGASPVNVRQKWLSVMEGLGDAYCHRDETLEIEKVACAAPQSLAEKSLCMQATSAFLQADECTEKQLNDAEICRRTCSWVSAAQTSRMNMLGTARTWILITEIAIFFVAILRLCKTVLRTAAIMRQLAKRYGWRKSILLQFGMVVVTNEDTCADAEQGNYSEDISKSPIPTSIHIPPTC